MISTEVKTVLTVKCRNGQQQLAITILNHYTIYIHGIWGLEWVTLKNGKIIICIRRNSLGMGQDGKGKDCLLCG